MIHVIDRYCHKCHFYSKSGCTAILYKFFMTNTIATAINKEILEFTAGNKIATICCTEANKPYCFNVFYSFLEEEGCIIFKSSESTRHMQILAGNNHVAGTVIASEISLTKVEGIQFEGVIVNKDTVGLKASKSYYLRYPFAVTVPGRLWILELNSIKYTNTTNGISNKKAWQR